MAITLRNRFGLLIVVNFYVLCHFELHLSYNIRQPTPNYVDINCRDLKKVLKLDIEKFDEM